MPRPLDLARPLLPLLPLLALAALTACTPRNPAAAGTGASGEPAGAPPADAKEAPPEAPPGEAAPPVAEEPRPAHPSASVGSLSVEVIPNYEVVDPASLPRHLDLLVRLRGDEKGAAKRPPLDLAVILDRSGSMSGDKLSAVKQASLDLLKELDAGDRVTLISYESGVITHTERLLADPKGIEALRGHLLPLTTAGGTALGPAMYQGLEILERAAGKRSEKDLAHVLLLSDGQANEGETRPDVLGARAAEGFARGVSLSTLGVGLDYNEDLMTKLADQGGGRYHFIQDAQAIPRVLGDEMAGLVATVANGVRLTMNPAPGLSVQAIYGYADLATDKGGRAAAIGSLGAGQIRDVLLRLDLPAATGESMALGVLGVDFTDLKNQGKQSHAELALTLSLSADPERLRRAENTEVTVRAAEVESAAKLEAATRAVAIGQYNQARTLLQEDIQRLETLKKGDPSLDLDEQIEELKDAEENIYKAQQSESERKIFEKSFKAKAYKKSKGGYDQSDLKAKKKKSMKDPFN
ncbi:MAG: VWA domain-containing protein [Myxococcales bacterium]|nr:VWA domain-containing protein [Myxococcales bacterium]